MRKPSFLVLSESTMCPGRTILKAFRSAGTDCTCCPATWPRLAICTCATVRGKVSNSFPSAWIDKVTYATVVMPEPELRYSYLFWTLPQKHVYMAVGHHRQVIMAFPDLDVVAVTTGRGNYPLSELAESISSSVKSDTALPADAASAKLLANKIREVSTEKPTAVGTTPKMAATISGKVYRFSRNE